MSWGTYQVLVHDLIGIKNNFIKTEKNGKGLEHYLDSQDSFWMSNKGLPFPEVEQNYTSFVQDYKEKKEAMIANKETEKLSIKNRLYLYWLGFIVN